jgi:hypothetical protein
MPKGRKLRSPKLDTEGNYLQQPIRHLGMLKELGRSCSDDFNETLIGQAFYSVWQGGCDTKEMQLKNGTDAEFVASHGGVIRLGYPPSGTGGSRNLRVVTARRLNRHSGSLV